MAFSLGATGGPERRGYEVNAGDSSATQYFRFYINSAECSGTISPLRGMNATSSGQRFRVGYDSSTRVLTLHNNANTTIWTAAALDAGVDYRVEVAAEGSTSATARVRIYQGHGTTAAEDSGDLTSVNIGGPIREVWWGQTNAATGVSG
jgi:hypothetical protein